MRAVSLAAADGIDSITVIDEPSPEPGVDEVVVAVAAATINPVDLIVVTGRAADRMPGNPPWTPGWDLAGTVTAVGPNVAASWLGRTVLGFSPWFQAGNGTQAAEVALPLERVAIASDALAAVELTTFGLNGLTALQALEAAAVPAGGTVLVVGSDGAVGGLVVELARHRGLNVVPVTRLTDRATLASVNADAVVTCAPPDASVLDGVRAGGTAISVTRPFTSVRGIASSRVGVRPDRAGLETIVGLAQSGVLHARVGRTYPVEQAREAYRTFAIDASRDRVVITFG